MHVDIFQAQLYMDISFVCVQFLIRAGLNDFSNDSTKNSTSFIIWAAI